MARPPIQISKTEFEKLCGLQCPLHEIADWFDCSEDTIERWCKRTYKKRFAEVFDQKRGRGRIALRRAQFELAKKNASMAIFLGKNYLGQRDQQEVKTVNEGALADLIDGLKEPVEYDLYAEAKGADGPAED